MQLSSAGPGHAFATPESRTWTRVLPFVLLAMLGTASLVNEFALPLAGRNVRPEHLAAPLAFTALAAVQLLCRRSTIRVDAFSLLVLAWVAINALSSWLYGPQLSDSVVHVVRMGLLALVFLTVANLPFRDAAEWTTALRLWLWLGLLALAYGLCVWFLARYGSIWLPGVTEEPLIAGPSLKGTQLERNLFGILAGTFLSVACYSLIGQRRDRPVASSGFLAIACLLAGSCVVLSLTRSAWVALASAAPLCWVLFDRRGPARADRPLLYAAVALPVLVGVLIAILRVLPAPSNAEKPAAVVVDRMSTLGNLESDRTLNTRLQDAKWALNDWLASPLLGHGTGSFGQIHGIRMGTEAWISNLVLHTLVDTGLVGLAIQLGLFALAARATWRAASVTGEVELRVGLRAMILGLLVMLIAYQLTDGTWLALFWIHLGLMVNGVYRVQDRSPAADGAR